MATARQGNRDFDCGLLIVRSKSPSGPLRVCRWGHLGPCEAFEQAPNRPVLQRCAYRVWLTTRRISVYMCLLRPLLLAPNRPVQLKRVPLTKLILRVCCCVCRTRSTGIGLSATPLRRNGRSISVKRRCGTKRPFAWQGPRCSNKHRATDQYSTAGAPVAGKDTSVSSQQHVGRHEDFCHRKGMVWHRATDQYSKAGAHQLLLL